jgi:hypothetical protein
MKYLLIILGVVFISNPSLKSQDIIIMKNGQTVNCKISAEDSVKIYFKMHTDNGDKITHIKKSEVEKVVYSERRPVGQGTIVLAGGGFSKFRNLRFKDDSIVFNDLNSKRSVYPLDKVELIKRKSSYAGNGFLYGCFMTGMLFVINETTDLEIFKAPIFGPDTYGELRKEGRIRAITIGGVVMFSCTLIGALVTKEKVAYKKLPSVIVEPDIGVINNKSYAGIRVSYALR